MGDVKDQVEKKTLHSHKRSKSSPSWILLTLISVPFKLTKFCIELSKSSMLQSLMVSPESLHLIIIFLFLSFFSTFTIYYFSLLSLFLFMVFILLKTSSINTILKQKKNAALIVHFNLLTCCYTNSNWTNVAYWTECGLWQFQKIFSRIWSVSEESIHETA